MHNPVGWFEIYVQDMARAKRFYEALFDMKLQDLGNPSGQAGMELWSFPMEQGGMGASGALVKMEGAPSGFAGTLVYFVTQECGAVAERAKTLGGEIVKPKFSIGQYGFIALVKDTEGNMIGLHSMG